MGYVNSESDIGRANRGAKVREFLDKKEALQRYMAQTNAKGLHPDGCFYCGGDHHTDDCRSDDRDRYWESEE